MHIPQLTSNIILLYKDRAPCVKLPQHKTCSGKSCLSKSDGQTARVMNKGRDWVESITNIPGDLEPELSHWSQPVEGVPALLVMGKMQILQKTGEKVIFWANSK
jgi:hypothetical protein